MKFKTGDLQEQALALVKEITSKAIEGFGPLEGADRLALDYLEDPSFGSTPERIEALIKWQAAKNFGSGFVTGLPGLVAMPVTIPAAFGASWVIQARMVAAIAKLHGHDLRSDRVQTMIILTILGDSAKNLLKDVGVKVVNQITLELLKQLPGKVLIEINKQVGFRLLTKFGERGIINLVGVIPVVSGVVAGSVDAAFCYKVGNAANRCFAKSFGSRAQAA
jgi:uncharacterized protein (DUF697 family)